MSENEPSDYQDTGESGEAFDTDKSYEKFTRRLQRDDGEEAMLIMRWLSQTVR